VLVLSVWDWGLTSVALAVGKEVFSEDAKGVLDLFERVQSETQDMHAAWARVCRVLGRDFLPWLDIVMTPLLASAALEPDFALVEDLASPDEGWQFLDGPGGKRIGINTSGLEEKYTAVSMLALYIRGIILRCYF
jgi:hypothetical protein